MRHAEKAAYPKWDPPPFNFQGHARAVGLIRILEQVRVTASLAAELSRTQESVVPPLAKHFGL